MTQVIEVNVVEETLMKREATQVATRISVPKDVVNKFDVESVTETVEQIIARKLAEETFDKEEAFYIVDLGVIIQKYQQWTRCLPRVQPYYAVKCNSSPAIVRTLASLGVNFDCASKSEIQQVLGSGVSASRIIYANPTKMKSHIGYAKSSSVDLMTFDNSDELHKIAECFPSARLVLRIITDDSHSVCRFSTKFGAPLSQCDSLLQLAKELNLNVVGVSFHVGSGCMSAQSFIAAIRSAKSIFKMGEEKGFQFSLLDLGGGWPGTDDPEDCPVTFAEIANAIRPVLDEEFPNVELIAEPGRYFVAQSHTLAVNVFAKRNMEQTEDGKKSFLYYVNDGVYQSFNCIFFDHAHPKPLVFKNSLHGSTNNGNALQMYESTVFGPTCDSLDCIAKNIMLPELEVGEWLYFKNMGAYTVAAASPFNGFKSCPTTFFVQSPSL